jgi:hypothetical protein
MPLKLCVGVARKVGQPGYSSAQASCALEIELDSGLLADPEALQARARSAHAACARAVREELERLTAPVEPDQPMDTGNGQGPRPDQTADRSNSARRRPVRPATPAQVQALKAIARDYGADLTGLLKADYGVGRPEELSSAQASKLIDTLRAAAQL